MRQLLHSASGWLGGVWWRVPVGALVVFALPVLLALASAEPIAAETLGGTYRGAGTGQSVKFTRNDNERDAWAGTLRFALDSGEEVLVFCIQLDVGVRANDRYKGESAVEDLPYGCQIRYILDHYSGATADTRPEAAARQMAVWHFSDAVELDKVADVNADVRERAISIAAEAEASVCPARRVQPPDLKVAPASTTVATGERLVYAITAGDLDAQREITATLSGPAVFDDGRQEARATLDASGAVSLGVTSTADGESSLAVFLPYRLEAGIVFSEVDATQPTQRLVMAQHLDAVAQAQAQAIWLTEATATGPAPTDPATRQASTSTPAPTQTSAAATETPAVATATARVPTGTAGPSVTPKATGSGNKETAQPASSPAATTGGPEVPAALPKTGGRGPDAWAVLAIAALLLVAGRLARRDAPM